VTVGHCARRFVTKIVITRLVRVIQYSRAFVSSAPVIIINALEYWVLRVRGG
jgi:hypothetical protein